MYCYKWFYRTGWISPPVATWGVDVELVAVEHCFTPTQFAGIEPCILAKVQTVLPHSHVVFFSSHSWSRSNSHLGLIRRESNIVWIQCCCPIINKDEPTGSFLDHPRFRTKYQVWGVMLIGRRLLCEIADSMSHDFQQKQRKASVGGWTTTCRNMVLTLHHLNSANA